MRYLTGKPGWLLLLALGLAFPWFARNDYHLTVMSTAYIFALATVGLNLITGYTGQFNLAHSGFMAVGAYTVGILTVDHQVPFWIAFALSGVTATVLGFFIGLVSLRLKGHYFSIFTLCVGYIMFLVIEKWEGLTHGTVGIIGIPAPSPIGPLAFDSPRSLYYLVFFFLVLGVWVMHRIVTSLLGRTFMAIRNGDELAESLGINLMRNKLLAFMLSVFYAGLAGGLYAGFVRFLGPGLAGVEHTFDMTMYMLVGGLGTLLGPLLGALAVPWLTQYLQFLQEYRFIVFGPILVLLVIFLPHGIVGTWLGWRARREAGVAAPSRNAPIAGPSAAEVGTRPGGSHA
ncbi:branched-chain amino acid ABC transporter permease [Ramlibacter tataouinensis]|uniref:Candidate ABC type branched chain amino acid transport systems, permease component n=1 Tax=Ramlibacter tataouinensis (strain ATCC BAA-407 / DSM 14655 / LMG 21543 / TTB310) TaxID=365046 RepID=F5Y1Q9_RAMTT|nr:branched-chain amino acid ABC transporter permease [Ramlibacter tataouinensis]AEG92310.1 candidate ABC type branched chain amino acid transport systems, permease component [Ramlibacter tataouinensis TTB310]